MAKKFSEKVKAFIGFEPIPEEGEEEMDFQEVEEEEKPKYTAVPPSTGKKQNTDERVSEFQRKAGGHMKLMLVEPSTYEEASKIVDSLKIRKPIIVNLENLDSDVARKIFDFVSGATYALDGSVQKIANSIFIFAPDNVDIAANIENKGYEEDSGNPWR